MVLIVACIGVGILILALALIEFVEWYLGKDDVRETSRTDVEQAIRKLRGGKNMHDGREL